MSERHQRPDTLPPDSEPAIPKRRTASGSDWPLAPDIAKQLLEEQARPETGGTKTMKNLLGILSLVISLSAALGMVWNAATVQTQMRADIDGNAKAMAAHLVDVSQRHQENEERMRSLESAVVSGQTSTAVLGTRLDTINQTLGELKSSVDGLRDRRNH